MTGKEIIQRILEDEKITAQSLADRIGDKRPQAIYDIQHEKTKRVSKAMASKIVAAFPHYSLEWLTTGEGDIYANPDCVAAQRAKAMTREDMLISRIDKLIEMHERDTRNMERLITLLEQKELEQGSNDKLTSSL